MGWYWDWDGQPTRRRPADGIKAQSRKFGQTWWASRWLAALEGLVDSARLSRGRSYARSGQVLNIDIRPGCVAARVQGSRPTPYKVRIEIEPLAERQWTRVAKAMAAQAIFAAKLLAGEMPQDIEEAFAAAEVSLFPAERGDLVTECSCPDWANPCKHVAAVYYLLGERFDADPFLLFLLRGKSKEEVIAMLRARRAASAAQPSATSTVAPPDRDGHSEQEDQSPSLERSLDRFWEAPLGLEDFPVTIQRPAVDGVPVKRLGRPGFWHDEKLDLLAVFEDIYHVVSQQALDLALGNNNDFSSQHRDR